MDTSLAPHCNQTERKPLNKSDAKAALRAQGIYSPSSKLVEDYMRVQQAEEWALEVPSPLLRSKAKPERSSLEQIEQEASNPNSIESRPHPSSESNLEPLLRERGELQRPAGRRKAGRPRVLAAWYQAVATRMADGTPLRKALALCGIYGLAPKQLRSLYRNRSFQALYKEARRKFLSDYGKRSPQALRKMREYAGL
jgi:hypothetical protein